MIVVGWGMTLEQVLHGLWGMGTAVARDAVRVCAEGGAARGEIDGCRTERFFKKPTPQNRLGGIFFEGSDKFNGLKFRKTSGIPLKSDRLLDSLVRRSRRRNPNRGKNAPRVASWTAWCDCRSEETAGLWSAASIAAGRAVSGYHHVARNTSGGDPLKCPLRPGSFAPSRSSQIPPRSPRSSSRATSRAPTSTLGPTDRSPPPSPSWWTPAPAPRIRSSHPPPAPRPGPAPRSRAPVPRNSRIQKSMTNRPASARPSVSKNP